MADLQPEPPGVVVPDAAGMPAQMRLLLRFCLQSSDMLHANDAVEFRLCIPDMKLSRMHTSDAEPAWNAGSLQYQYAIWSRAFRSGQKPERGPCSACC